MTSLLRTAHLFNLFTEMIGKSAKVSWFLVPLACYASAFASPKAEQLPIARVEQMPKLPQPYQMRDWGKVTEDNRDFLENTECRGEHLPLMPWRETVTPPICLAYEGFLSRILGFHQNLRCLTIVF